MRCFSVAVGIALATAVLAPSRSADAAGLWMSTNGMAPNELRIAIAASPERTTVWTSLAFDSWPTTVGLVVPVPDGTMVDVSPDAWFDALDMATAPRIYPAADLSCPDGSPPNSTSSDCAASALGYYAQPSIPAASFDVLDTTDAVTAWANDHDMAVPSDVAATFASLGGTRFVAVRFIVPPPGSGLTQTVRFVMPGVSPRVALSLFNPGYRTPLVTTYLIGRGRGSLVGANPFVFDGTQLEARGCPLNNYVDALYGLLGPGTALVQYAGSGVWTSPVNLDGLSQFDSIVHAYFGNAEAGDTHGDTCVADTSAALAQPSLVGTYCPPAAAALVDGGAPCNPPFGEKMRPAIDPMVLACGPADDVAVAFSGLGTQQLWVTRETLALHDVSQDYGVSFADGDAVSPLVYASLVDPVYDCPSSGTGGGSTSSSGGSGCDGSAADGAEAGAEGCSAAAEAAGAIGDAAEGCSVSRPRARRASPWIVGLALVLYPLRRRGTRRRVIGAPRALPSPRPLRR
jgi:hypothetical protein